GGGVGGPPSDRRPAVLHVLPRGLPVRARALRTVLPGGRFAGGVDAGAVCRLGALETALELTSGLDRRGAARVHRLAQTVEPGLHALAGILEPLLELALRVPNPILGGLPQPARLFAQLPLHLLA